MSDQFDITPDEGRIAVASTGELSKITYHNVMSVWKHDTGSCLTLERIGDFPLYLVVWRSNPFWVCKALTYADRFEEPNAALAWAEGCSRSRKAFALGPSHTVRAKAELEMANKAKAGKKRANSKQEQKRVERNSARVEAGVSSEPGAPVMLPDTPVEPLENEFWEIKQDEDTSEISYYSLEVKGVWITVGLASDGFWRVRRRFYPDGNESAAPASDIVETLAPERNGKFERYTAITVANQLALTDLKKWKRGEYQDRKS